MVNKREIGTRYEEMACDYLHKNGVHMLEKNFRCRQGEIDIIGQDKETLVFFEVKYRATMKNGAAEEAVTPEKQRKICRTADYYRYCHNYGEDRPIRYDVIAINGKGTEMTLVWYQNAFSHVYGRHR